MKPINYLYKLFEDNVKRARNSYKETKKEPDKRTARASSLNNALKNIQNQLRGIQ